MAHHLKITKHVESSAVTKTKDRIQLSSRPHSPSCEEPRGTIQSTPMASTPEQRLVHAYAAHKAEFKVEPWTYVARPLGDQDIEIQISHCGICGSDLHTLNGWEGTTYPVVVGHEIIGIVTQAGPNVTNLKVGDRVGVGAQVFACLNRNPEQPCDDCAHGRDPHCPKIVFTYNAEYEDGNTAYGGYADYIRVLSDYAFKIPDNIPSDVAAPLLCAGATVFTPLQHHGVKAGDRVGVVGIGGLGHLALQFIRALGATAVAISNSPSKEAEARMLGATDFINMRDPASVERAAGSLTHVLSTADADHLPYDTYLGFLQTHGKFILVGIPNKPLEINALSLIIKGVSIHGSLIGGIEDIKQMLDVASKKNVRPVIQKLPMNKVNEGLSLVHQGKARYRIVLENPPF